MQSYKATKSTLTGNCHLPASKSQSIRALLFASMAEGISTIENILPSPDAAAMISACKQLGASIKKTNGNYLITGIKGKPKTPNDIIDAGNSGQVLRFIACLAGLQNNYLVITGDHSIRHNRPVAPLIEALPKLGVMCDSLRGDGFAPLILKGPFTSDTTELCGEDSQPVSGLLMAAVFIDQTTHIKVNNPGELPWIGLTLRWLDRFNISYKNDNGTHYQVTGGKTITAFHYRVPGDLSSLSFPLVAAIISQSSIVIHDVDMEEPQGDKAIIKVLQSMGANITIDTATHSLAVHPTKELQGIDVNINDFIDCIAILAVAGCYAQGTTRITGAAIARQKESDRITAIATELRKMGAEIEELPDGMIIQHSPLSGAHVESHHDHRIAMSLAVAGMQATGETMINDIQCVDKSFPDFSKYMYALGAHITTTEST